MSIKVIRAGMQTSIQDLGRFGFMDQGIPRSGFMDPLSATLANTLVGNVSHHPALEICMLGPELLFNQDISIAICGAVFEVERLRPHSPPEPIHNNLAVKLKAGDKLRFAKRLSGARAYLAFSAGLAIKPELNSHSTHFGAKFGGFKGRALMAGDEIPLTNIKAPGSNQQTPTEEKSVLGYGGRYILRCVDSVETSLFSRQQQRDFYHNKYQVGQASNRMGLRLDGPPLSALNIADISSSGLLNGSIQIPPGGLPIISGVDGQTIGGYPRIANVISADLFALGQLVPGDQVQFVKVCKNQAHTLLVSQKHYIKQYTS